MKTLAELRQLHGAAVRDFESAKKQGGRAGDIAALKIETEVLIPLEQAMALLVMKNGQALARGLNDMSEKMRTALEELQSSIDAFFIDDLVAKAGQLGLARPQRGETAGTAAAAPGGAPVAAPESARASALADEPAGATAGVPGAPPAVDTSGTPAAPPAAATSGTPASPPAGNPAGAPAAPPAGAPADTPVGVTAAAAADRTMSAPADTSAGDTADAAAGATAGTPADIPAGAPNGPETAGSAVEDPLSGAAAVIPAGTLADTSAGATADTSASASAVISTDTAPAGPTPGALAIAPPDATAITPPATPADGGGSSAIAAPHTGGPSAAATRDPVGAAPTGRPGAAVPVLKLTAADWRAIFPRAPQEIIDAFVAGAGALDEAGITHTRTRLAYALANVEHECSGFTIRNLTENIRYTAKRMAAVWPNRFSSAAAVQAKYGTGAGWQNRAFDDIYGNRMGNRPGTSDGSAYIGRGGPQITGRDCYDKVGGLCRLDLVGDPDLATRPEHQPAILAAFWTWKNLNAFADRGDFKGCVKKWNGGTNGFADRQAQMKGNDPIIQRLSMVTSILPVLDRI